MWLASEMAAFAHVVELGSFTAAARALQVPKVAVSRAIASLERRLGSRLLTRTTRRIALTPAGALLQPHCRRVLQEVDAVRARFAPAAGPQRLRVLVDAGYGRLLITPLVPRFLESFPGIELQVSLTDTLPTVPDESWDVLICNAPADHPGLTQTTLGNLPLLLVATPAYLAPHGRPAVPADLNAHTVMRVLGAESSHGARSLTLRRNQDVQQIRLRPALQVNDPGLVHSSTAAGLGIGVLPEFLCRQGLALGKLERLLPDWSVGEPLELSAVHAESNAGSVAVHQFLGFLLANMVPVLASSDAQPRSSDIRSDRYQHRAHPHRPMPRSESE